MGDDFTALIDRLAAEAARDRPQQMLLVIDESAERVELVLDNKANMYHQFIPGLPGDCGIYRERDTDKVMGCYLPLRVADLHVERIEKLEIVRTKEECKP